MTAIVIDLKDFDTRTPEQAVRIFLSLYDYETVYTRLMQLFIRCAKDNEPEGTPPGPDSTAQLFDHLIALTKALHQLREHTPGRCVLCKRSPATDEQTG